MGVEGAQRLRVGAPFAPRRQAKRLRHFNFFPHECSLEVGTPRVRLRDGRVAQIEPDWFGKLADFTLLFEALVLALADDVRRGRQTGQ
jgi:hypothetical protein